MNKLAHLFLTALTIAILTMLAAIAWSQPVTDAMLTATILDSVSNQPLIHASIQISINKGGITNSNGIAKIMHIRPNNYDLVVKYIGYSWKTIPNLVIRKGDSLHYVILLSPKRDTQIVSILPIKPPIEHKSISIHGLRQADSIIRYDPPYASDQVSGGVQYLTISKFQSFDKIDTTSRVYRVYYKK